MAGDLSLHGITKSVILDVIFNGTIDTGKGVKAGFKISGTINRKDWGLTWNNIIESGGVEVVLGETTIIDLRLQVPDAHEHLLRNCELLVVHAPEPSAFAESDEQGILVHGEAYLTSIACICPAHRPPPPPGLWATASGAGVGVAL